MMTRLFQTVWKKPKVEDIAESWHFSVSVLLKRIFKNWSSSDKECTKNLHRNLTDFQYTVCSEPPRMHYPDYSHPPMVKVGTINIPKNTTVTYANEYLSQFSWQFPATSTGGQVDFRAFAPHLRRSCGGPDERQVSSVGLGCVCALCSVQ